MPLVEAAMRNKFEFLSKENALNYTQSNNETFRRYAPYRRRDTAENLICPPRKMSFIIH